MAETLTRPAGGVARLLTAPRLLITCAVFFWAGNFVVGRALRDAAPPVTLNFWRWALALAILLPLSAGLLREHRALLLARWKLVAALGATGIAGFHTLAYQALAQTTAVSATLFATTAPLMIVLISWLIFRDTITGRQALGIVVSLLGAVLLIARGRPEALLQLQFNAGDLWALASVPVWSLYSVLLKRRPAALPPLALLTASVVAGLAILAPFFLWRLWEGERLAVSGPSLLGVLYIAVFASVIAFICWNRGVAAIGPNRAGTFLHLMPLFGALLSVAFLGEWVAPFHLAGAALVFAGIWLAGRGR